MALHVAECWILDGAHLEVLKYCAVLQPLSPLPLDKQYRHDELEASHCFMLSPNLPKCFSHLLIVIICSLLLHVLEDCPGILIPHVKVAIVTFINTPRLTVGHL